MGLEQRSQTRRRPGYLLELHGTLLANSGITDQNLLSDVGCQV